MGLISKMLGKKKEVSKIINQSFPSTLFVCAGNTCRSPMAEHLLKMLCLERGLKVEAASRGLGAGSEFRLSTSRTLYATEEAYLVIKELDRKTRIKDHIPRPLGYEDIARANLVLTMGEAQMESIIRYLKHRYGENALRKVFTLKEYAGYDSDFNVQDPMGEIYEPRSDNKSYELVKKSPEECLGIYRECRDEIKKCLEQILENPEPNIGRILKARKKRQRLREEEKFRQMVERAKARRSAGSNCKRII